MRFACTVLSFSCVSFIFNASLARACCACQCCGRRKSHCKIISQNTIASKCVLLLPPTLPLHGLLAWPGPRRGGVPQQALTLGLHREQFGAGSGRVPSSLFRSTFRLTRDRKDPAPSQSAGKVPVSWFSLCLEAIQKQICCQLMDSADMHQPVQFVAHNHPGFSFVAFLTQHMGLSDIMTGPYTYNLHKKIGSVTINAASSLSQGSISSRGPYYVY